MHTDGRHSFVSRLIIVVQNVRTAWRHVGIAQERMLHSSGITEGSSEKSVARREGGMQDLSHDRE